MPLTTYVAGDVLTAQSLNDNFTFAAENPPGGMVFLHSSTFSAATSVSLPDSTFSNDFDNYKLFLSITSMTSNADFTLRLRAAGADNTTNNYSTVFLGLNENGATSNEVSNSTSSIKLGESRASFSQRYAFQLEIMNPNLAKNTSIFGNYQFVDKTPIAHFMRCGSGQFQEDTVFDSLTFISSVASNISGTIFCFGYKN